MIDENYNSMIKIIKWYVKREPQSHLENQKHYEIKLENSRVNISVFQITDIDKNMI